MAETAIEWADKVWNPVTGCSKVSQGCKFCYAERIARLRWGQQYGPNADGSVRSFTDVRVHPDRLLAPLSWRTPQRVFVNSMSDLFHDAVPDEFIRLVFTIMAQPIAWGGTWPRHTYLVLTKRPERMRDFVRRLRWKFGGPYRHHQTGERPLSPIATLDGEGIADPAPNVWLGVSAERQREANERIPLLIETPAAVRFLSCEPLLGPIDLGAAIPCGYYCDPGGPGHVDHPFWSRVASPIQWVIVGGESGGPLERRLLSVSERDLGWVRSLRDQCLAAQVPFFFKQWGGATPKAGGRLLDAREWSEFPTEAAREAVPA